MANKLGARAFRETLAIGSGVVLVGSEILVFVLFADFPQNNININRPRVFADPAVGEQLAISE